MSSSPRAEADEDKELLQIKEITESLFKVVFDQKKREALENLTSSDAQSMIDYLNTIDSHPHFLKMADPKLPRHTLMVLVQLCKNSKLYPTCNTLDGIEGLLQKDGGGFCDIFQGRYQGQNICFKVVRVYNKQEEDDLLKAHASEAVLWSRLEHVNIAPTYGFFRLKEMNNRVGLLSPWMEKGNIMDYLRREPDVPRRPFLHDVASGLKYLHDNHIVHGDLKGVNVLVDEFSTARLTDFGVSKIITNGTLDFKLVSDLNYKSTVRCTPLEVLEKEACPSKESDIWSFGCVCFEILTGLLPYKDCANVLQIIRQLIENNLPAQPADHVLDKDPAVNEQIWELMRRCWSFDATKRPECSNVLQMMEDSPDVWGITEGLKRDTNHVQRFQYTTTSKHQPDHDLARQRLEFIVKQFGTVPITEGDTEDIYISGEAST